MKKLFIRNKLLFVFLVVSISAITSCIIFRGSARMNYIVTYPLAISAWIIFFVLLRRSGKYHYKEDDSINE